jgi:triphosphatase
MSRSQEIELKLEVDEASVSLLRDHPLLSGREIKAARQVSTYFDTEDSILRKAGFSLRVRKAGDRYLQTIKQNGHASAGLFDRPEWEKPVETGQVDLDAAAATPLAEILTKKVRNRLAPVIEADVRRTVWNIMQGGSEVELILDEGIITGGANSVPVNELELELIAGSPDSLLDVARELAGQVPLRLGVQSKAERGYALANGASGKVVKAERIPLRPGMTAAQGFAAIANACLRHFRLNEPLVVERRDSAALHQSRVAMRRLRSAFTLFGPVIEDEEYGRLRGEVRWFTGQLGDARNLDVLLRRLSDGKKDEAGAALRDRLEGARELAYGRVLEAIDSRRLRRLMLDLVAWIETGRWRRDNQAAATPLSAFAVRQLDKRWRKVKRGGREIETLEAEPRHQLRIEIKKLRYAVEFLAALQTEETTIVSQKAFLDALEEMQERLGDLNDAETARELLARLVGTGKRAEAMLSHAERSLAAERSERKQLEAAAAAYGKLRGVGPFWR